MKGKGVENLQASTTDTMEQVGELARVLTMQIAQLARQLGGEPLEENQTMIDHRAIKSLTGALKDIRDLCQVKEKCAEHVMIDDIGEDDG